MAIETTEVAGDELLMRRIADRQYRRHRQPPLQEAAFLPRKLDVSGISLARRQSTAYPHFFTPQQLKESVENKSFRETCGVVEVKKDFVASIGLSVRPEEDPRIPGHVVIPELNHPEWEGDKSTPETRAQIRIWVAQLVDEVVKQNAIPIESGKS